MQTIHPSEFDPIMHRSSTVLGVDPVTPQQATGDRTYRIQINVLLPQRLVIPVSFPGHPLHEVTP